MTVSDQQQDVASDEHDIDAPTAPSTVPSLAEGVELIGEYEGSGFKVPPSIVQRADGQVIQLPPLLYSVAAKIDGQRDMDGIAADVSAEIGRGLDGAQVQFLVEDKLRPLGILTAADGSSPALEKPDPFLGFRFRAAVISERRSERLGATFAPLFHPLVIVVALGAFVAVDVWLFLFHGIAQSLRQTLYHPGYFLPLFGAIVLSAAFHETGHAAGCRYGGCHPGKMGCGLYLAWPAFYTDVTDAYRLGKRGRLRTDLGGVYFNVLVVLVTTALYVVTGLEPLLLLVIIQHFEIAHQLLPVVRLDGYYIVADLTGVPDLFSRIGPILRSMVPWRSSDERVTVLKRWVRAAVTMWVLVVVPLLLFELLLVLIHLPRIIGTSWDSAQQLWNSATTAFSDNQVVPGISAVVQVVVLVIPIVGILLMLAKLGRQITVGMWKRTEGRPLARGFAIAVSAGVIAILLAAWIPRHNYRPIQPGEKGTLTEALHGLRTVWIGEPLDGQQAAPPPTPPPARPTREPATPASSGTTNSPTSPAPLPAGPATDNVPTLPARPPIVTTPTVTVPAEVPPAPPVTSPTTPTTVTSPTTPTTPSTAAATTPTTSPPSTTVPN